MTRQPTRFAAIGPILLAACQLDSTEPPEGAAEVIREETGELRTGWFDTEDGPVELTYERIGDDNVWQGDILLPEPGQRSGGTSSFGSRWPHGIVQVESSGLFDDPRIVDAIQHWEDRTSLRFVFGATSGDRLQFVNPADQGNCSSWIGKTGGAQAVNIGNWCGTGQAIHEIGHAIGLFHEQSRTDRDAFVTVNWGCIQAGKSHNFNTFGNDGLNLGPYDLNSIMHYGSTFFLDSSVAGCTSTISLVGGGTINPNRAVLSGGDIAGSQALYLQWTARQPTDYDHDGRHDIAVFRPPTGEWFVIDSSTGGSWGETWGDPNDIPVPGDYNFDGMADVAVWRPSTGDWWVLVASGGVIQRQWGQATDIPVPGDYDNDGLTDFAVFRPSDGTWYVQTVAGTTWSVGWGAVGDVPVPADYDGDGATDYAIWRRSDGNWWVLLSSGGFTVDQWGVPNDVAVAADYDADGRADRAIWRPNEGNWYILYSTGGSGVVQWGIETDTPVPGDYNGDGATETAVFWSASSEWYLPDGQVIGWGAQTDVPVP